MGRSAQPFARRRPLVGPSSVFGRTGIVRSPGGIPARRMLGVPAAVLAENVPKLGIVQERPYLRVVGALKVVARLSRPSRLQQNLEVLLRTTREPRVPERLGEERAPATRRRADEIESFGATAFPFVSFTGSPASPSSGRL